MGRAREELVDRLLTSALIELRSCERFEILGRKCPDPILKKLYRSLWASEHGHYSVFVELAAGVKAVKGVAGRWKELLREEAEIISSEPVHCGIHGWVE
jgi:tRNA-(ms[2]io[6]A)-hydroxylase